MHKILLTETRPITLPLVSFTMVIHTSDAEDSRREVVRADNADNADKAVGIAARTEGGTEERENETARNLTYNDLQQELRKYRSSFSLLLVVISLIT